MTVYVDRLRAIRRCHMWADSTDDLYALANQLGLKREWAQVNRGRIHFDLTPAQRAKAISLGVQEWVRIPK